MLTLPISAKVKAVVGALSALAIVLTGVAADNVLNLNDLTTYGAQLLEVAGAYAAIFKAPRNATVLDKSKLVTMRLADGDEWAKITDIERGRLS